MAYTITVNFGPYDLNPAATTPDTWKMILVIDVDAAGSNESFTGESKGLVVVDHGKIKLDYDLEDRFMVPGTYKVSISDNPDPDDGDFEYLFSKVFGDADVDPKFSVEIQVNGTTEFKGKVIEDELSYNKGTHILEFTAAPELDILNKTAVHGDDGQPFDPLSYSEYGVRSISAASYSSNEVTITHAADTEINVGDWVKISGVVGMDELNGIREVTDDTSSTSTKVRFNTDQTYVSGGTMQKIASGATGAVGYVYFEDMLDDIFQLVDAGLSVSGGEIEVIHDWKFWAASGDVTVTNAVSTDGGTKVQVTTSAAHGLSVSDLVRIYTVVGMTDLNEIWTVINVVDATNFKVVLATAQTYTSGGIVEKGDGASPFESRIEQLWLNLAPMFYPDGVTATVKLGNLGDLMRSLADNFFFYCGMIHQERAFIRKLFYYDGSDLQTLGTVQEWIPSYRWGLIEYVEMRVAPGQVTEKTYSAGTFTTQENRSLKLPEPLSWFFLEREGAGLVGATNTKLGNAAAPLAFVDDAHDPEYDPDEGAGWYPIGELLAEVTFLKRGEMRGSRVDHFVVDGVDYDFLKNFTHSSGKYWIIKMVKDFEQYQTTIDAIYLGSV